MTPHRYPSFIILGITSDSRSFRPSDWAERLAGTMSVVGHDKRMVYSAFVQPGMHQEICCVRVDARLNDVAPLAYAFMESFARDNDLKVVPWERNPDG